jgi:hypothetical protein
LNVVNDDQFSQLMDVLKGISSRLGAVETTLAATRCSCNHEDIVRGLVGVQQAVQQMHSGYSLAEVVKALWSVEKAAARK